MLMMRKMITKRYVQPLIFSKILECDASFIKMLESLEPEEVLLLYDEVGSIFFYLIMSLYDVSDIQHDSSNAIRKRLKKVLLAAIQQSGVDEGQVISSQVGEIREITGKLKLAYKSVSNRICTTLLNVLGSDVHQEREDPDTVRQNKKRRTGEMYKCVVRAVEILADKINAGVAEHRISPDQVSQFLSYSNGACDGLMPDVMSAFVKLYYLIDDPDLAELSYSLVKVFLMKFSEYKLDAQGRNAMHYAVSMCDYERQESFLCEIIQLLVYERFSILDEVDVYGNNPLHYAACSPYVNYQVIRYFIKNSPSMLTQQNANGDTPLHVMSYTYFINFAKILSFYNITYRNNISRLEPIVEKGVPLSEMRKEVSLVRRNDEVLSKNIEEYVKECVSTYKLLLTIVPFSQLFEVRNNAGHSVYDIMNSNIVNICNGDLEALLQDFSRASSRLPIYDVRIDAQRDLCVDLCFSKQVAGKSGYGHMLYMHIKRMYDLISYKFTEMSNAKMRYMSIESERGNFKFLRLLVFMVLSCLLVLDIILCVKTAPILGMECGLYRSVLFSMMSIVVIVSVCVSYALYTEHMNVTDDKMIEQEKENVRSILLSHLDIQETSVSQKAR